MSGDDTSTTPPTQRTQPAKGKPVEIPVPTRGEFDELVRKVAGPPEGRKPPDEKDPPPERSD